MKTSISELKQIEKIFGWHIKRMEMGGYFDRIFSKNSPIHSKVNRRMMDWHECKCEEIMKKL